MPRLPPLPPLKKWSTYFPARYLVLSPRVADSVTVRKTRGRVLLSSSTLTDQFVRALGIREDEVVLEGYAGVGSVTRSLISGGRSVEEANKWRADEYEDFAEGKAGERAVRRSVGSVRKLWADVKKPRPKRKPKAWPDWLGDLDRFPVGEEVEEGMEPTRRPRVVIATEGSNEILVRGMNYYDPDVQEDGLVPVNTPMIPSPYADNLILSNSTVYSWQTVRDVFDHPLVAPHMPVYDAAAPPEERTRRPWVAPAPPITLVSHLPEGALGDQLLSQWVGCAIGEEGQKRSWLWQFGRARLAVLCGQVLYERLTAKPGEKLHSKLTIMTNALFHVDPLPPYGNPKAYRMKFHKGKSGVPKSSIPAKGPGFPLQDRHADVPRPPPQPEKPTLVFGSEFYPGIQATLPLDQTLLFGLQLTPRVTSPIRRSQKDSWDFVLRKLLVRPLVSLGESLPSLGFGGESLIKKIEAEEGVGVPVDGRRLIAELELDEWARIVDVFDKWPFRPENLLLETLLVATDDTARELGQD
ncbi:hypothetical protein IAT38_000567 [Cryptococcus sp. DSM 104549]